MLERLFVFFFFLNEPAPTEFYPLPLPAALPIGRSKFDAPAPRAMRRPSSRVLCETAYDITPYKPMAARTSASAPRIPTSVTATICADVERSRSEEHTSELQSQSNLVCRLLLENK